MLPEPVRSLILDEQVRQGGRFITDADVGDYLAKLDAHAEIVSDAADGRCRGFVAFYANDPSSRQAYITLVLVDPRDRGTGLGRSLVNDVLEIARRRGFTSCGLEVDVDNAGARAMYVSLGFRSIATRAHKELLEITL